MKINNKILIIILLLLIIFSLYKRNKIEKYENREILTNGSFENGENIVQKSGESGYNNIITLINPSDSEHILKQSSIKNDYQMKEVYYQLTINLMENTSYN